jgi:outer membrane protein TolC
MYRIIAISILGFLLFTAEGSAQEFDYVHHRMMADSLARIALTSTPEIDQQDFELLIRDEKIKREKLGWLSSFRMGVQFLSVNQDFDNDITRVGVLPTMGVSLQLDFERFFTTPSRIRSARYESENIKLEKTRLEKVRVNQITSFYYDYVLLVEQTQVRFTTLQTVKEQGKLIEERFRNGETDLNTYLNSVNSIDNATEAFYETKIAAEKMLTLLENELGLEMGSLQ